MSQPALESSRSFHGPAARERWERAWQHRETLLKVARRRTLSEDEAQDAVSEALIRSVQAEHLDDARLAAWLTRVTVNLCTDIARDRARWSRRAEYTRRHQVVEPSPEQAVIDRDLAAAVVRRMARLPMRQREALLLRAAGFTVDDIAQQLDVSYKSAESLLARARTSLRAVITLGVAAVIGLGRFLRRGAKAAPVSTAATALAATLAIVSMPGADTDTDRKETPIAVGPVQLDSAQIRTPDAERQRPPSAALGRRDGLQRALAPRKPVVRERNLKAGRLAVDTPTVTRGRPSESTLETVLWCVRRGVLVSPSYIGCRR